MIRRLLTFASVLLLLRSAAIAAWWAWSWRVPCLLECHQHGRASLRSHSPLNRHLVRSRYRPFARS